MKNQDIIDYICKSQAFANPCFEQSALCPGNLPATKLRRLANDWHAVAKQFATTLPNLVAIIAKECQHETDPIKLHNLETLGREVLKILGNDWGLGVKKFDDTDDHKGIHYKLFERIPAKLGFIDKLEPETIRLMNDLQNGFSRSVLGGFGKLLVVEYTASNILQIGQAFAQCIDAEGEKFFTKSDLVYFPLHEELEKVHSDDTQNLLDLMGTSKKIRSQIFDSVRNGTEAFGNFWQKMAEITFN